MAFGLHVMADRLVPAARCDRCSGLVGVQGVVLWEATNPGAALIACSDECLATLTVEGSRDWLAIALDAYLAGLIHRLGVDLEAVEQRERAAAAAELTRREGPE